MSSRISKLKLSQLSIRTKWSAVILVLCIAPLAASCLFYVNYFGSVTKTDNQQNAKMIEELSIARISDWMQMKLSAIEELVKQHPEFKSFDPKVVLPPLRLLNESDSQIDNYILIHPDGKGIDVSNAAFDVANRDYFKKAMATKKPAISDMVLSQKTKTYVLPMGVPFLDDSGNVAGMISASASPGTFSQLTDRIKLNRTGYGYIISGQGDYYTYPDSSRIGKKVTDYAVNDSLQNAFKTILADTEGSVTYTGENGKEVITYFQTIPETSWKLLITVPTAEIYANVNKATMMSVWLLIGIVLLVALVAIMLIRLVSKPIVSVSAALKEVSDGNLRSRLEVKSGDEIGQICGSVNNMIDSLSGIVQQINRTIDQVAGASGELLESAEQSAASSEEISSAIQEMSQGTEIQMQGAEQSASAMEEMASGVQRIAEAAETVSDQAGEVAREVEDGFTEIKKAIRQMNVIGQSANRTSGVIGELYSHSEEIGKIVHVISDISNQTALLSLNASIEAARAGEHGKGFAVVANEVKKLAEQTKQSVATIAELIHSIQTTSSNAMDAMQTNVLEIEEGIANIQVAGTTFDTILASMRQVSAQTQEVSATTEELSAGTEEITSSIENMVGIARDSAGKAQTIAGSSEEQAAIMEDITASVKSLNSMMGELQQLVKIFKI
ncbi:methyl-accepting chemotaxis protein [Paenibacillus humicola]|uniref:methyl-accepting chemotaxis protein n=1 Tax=Paenibacillus humicola TaxID=3110540 RepID=UPI00237C22A8|nr:methyl-accepting chemotaxis protein [Paenibacillus humicola]